MKLFRVPTNIIRIMSTIVLMFIMIGIMQGLYAYDQTKTSEQRRIERLETVKELDWQLIEAVIQSNYNHAEVFADDIKLRIEANIINAYFFDRDMLNYDLENPNPNARAFTIFAKEVKGKYLNNIHNNNNDPFIASRNGILSDFSLNCSSNNVIRSWDNELDMHVNKILGAKAIDAIRYQTNEPIFWEFRTSTNPNHIMINDMTIKELKRVYMTEGLDGLETYEFLKPVYIQQYADIFGVSDVSNTGMKQQNAKLIVVSGFNIHDILQTYHKQQLNVFETYKILINKDHDEAVHHNNFVNVLVCVIILFFIIMTIIINNCVVSMLKDININEKEGKE